MHGAAYQGCLCAWRLIPSVCRTFQIFCSSSGGGAKVAAEFGAPFLGRVPMDPALTEAAERGQSASSAAKAAGSARAIAAVAKALLAQVGEHAGAAEKKDGAGSTAANGGS